MTASIGFDIYAKDRASSTFKNVGDSADRAGGKLSKIGHGVKVAGAAMAAGLGVAAIGAFKLAKAAAEDEAAAVKLSTALKNNAGATKAQVKATEDWITAQGKALGVTDDELRPALGKLVTATHDVSKAQKLASLAMDVSAGSGKSLDSVSTALMKAQNGQVASLSKLGIATKDAEGKTLSFEQIQKNLAATFKGQAADAANTTAGRFERLKLVVTEAGESIGAKLLPPATQFAGWMLSTGIPALSQFNDWLKAKVGPSLQAVGAFIKNDVIPAAQGFADWFGNKIAPILADLYQNRIKQLIGAFDGLRGTVKDNQPELQKLGEWMKKGAEIAAQTLGPALKFLGSVQIAGLTTYIKWVITALSGFVDGVQAVVGAVKTMGSVVASVANGVVSSWHKISDGAGDVVSYIGSIPERLGNQVEKWGNAGRALIGAFVNGMKNAAGVVSGIAGNVWSAVRGMLNDAIGRLKSALNFTISLPGPDLSINVGDSIPYLARGTSYHKGGLAVVGEAGPELVNLPRGSAVYSNSKSRQMASSAGGSGSGDFYQINITGVIDANSAAREVEKVLTTLKRTRGGKALSFEGAVQ